MKSLLLSLAVTGILGYIFATLMDQNANSWLLKLPTWVAYILMVLCIIAYILTLYLGLTKIIYGQRLANLGGIVLSVFGICLFVMIILMEKGQNKAKPGQLDFAFAKGSEDLASIQPILTQTKLTILDIKFVSFWELLNSNDLITVCLQKGNIIGLSIKKSQLSDIACLSKLEKLSALIINDCGLSKIENLHLPKAERLNLNNNNLNDLMGIVAPKVKWLDVENNKLCNLQGIQNLPKAQYFNYQGNKIIDYSATHDHAFLNNLSANKK
ncbi:MAG: hypothetical protein IPO92_19340 [Saprospiraceae bacterium]|nr:hypothetical protein [Saprospiraceae bacterium]